MTCQDISTRITGNQNDALYFMICFGSRFLVEASVMPGRHSGQFKVLRRMAGPFICLRRYSVNFPRRSVQAAAWVNDGNTG